MYTRRNNIHFANLESNRFCRLANKKGRFANTVFEGGFFQNKSHRKAALEFASNAGKQMRILARLMVEYALDSRYDLLGVFL